MEPIPQVRIENLAVKYHSLEGETLALDSINLAVYKSEFISIIGPSGCGKSTLLNCIAGILPPTAGLVVINDRPVLKPSNLVGYMPQTDQLFTWRTIWKNVLLGLEVQGKVNMETKMFVSKLLKNYGLADFANHYPHQLSGGMRQRAALIRTLAIAPAILLLDEAFSALDYQTRLLVADEVKQIIQTEKKTAILVTHDLAEAISMADRVVVLTKRPGTIKNIHTINLSTNEVSPIRRREAPEFRSYFNAIWRELELHVS